MCLNLVKSNPKGKEELRVEIHSLFFLIFVEKLDENVVENGRKFMVKSLDKSGQKSGQNRKFAEKSSKF